MDNYLSGLSADLGDPVIETESAGKNRQLANSRVDSPSGIGRTCRSQNRTGIKQTLLC